MIEMDNKLKLKLSTLILVTPLTAYADHEEVFSTLFLEFGLFIVFIMILVFIKIRIGGKLIIGAVYFLATYFTFKYVDNLSYQKNMALINTLVAVIPSTVFLVSYFGLRKKFRKAD